MAAGKSYIRLFGGKLIGWVDEDGSGNKTVFNDAGQIVSRYQKSNNTTFDFGGRIIATGDVATGLLLPNKR